MHNIFTSDVVARWACTYSAGDEMGSDLMLTQQ